MAEYAPPRPVHRLPAACEHISPTQMRG
jgi:hypothetical protein